MRNLAVAAALLLIPLNLLALDIPPGKGPYKGVFSYGTPDRPRTNFTLEITNVRDTGDGVYKISGVISEPRGDFGPKNAKTLMSHFKGSWVSNGTTGATVTFTKTYDYDEHEVLYTGTFDWNEGTIVGKWRIDSLVGPFSMHLTQ